MLKGNKITKPVITSSVAAQQEAESWTSTQKLDHIEDGDGDLWHVEVVTSEGYSSESSNSFAHVATIVLSKDFGAEEFISGGVVDPEKDSRLIALLGKRRLTLELSPIRFKSEIETTAKQNAREYLNILAGKMKNSSLYKVKRQYLERWIDQSGGFGEKKKKSLVARL